MKLHTQTVSRALWETLIELCTFEELQAFRLVGGTALSLQIGHRMSIDIDLFTDATYRSIDFSAIEQRLASNYPGSDLPAAGNHTIGKSYYLHTRSSDIIKLDLFYTDTFQYPCLPVKHVRIAHPLEIAAMKLELISRGGRKKDFWDIHTLLERFTLHELLAAYEKRHPYGPSVAEILYGLTQFDLADNDFQPICLQGKYWELIKFDLEKIVESIERQ
jgi:hypothetical protein